MQHEYSSYLASTATIFNFTVISKYLNVKCLHYTKVSNDNMFVVQTVLSFFA